MKWSELSDDFTTWTLPAERAKNGRVHITPLPAAAREIIASTVRINACPYVFTTNNRTPVSGWSKSKARLDKLMGDTLPWRLHDLRRTAVTGMGELGIAPHVIELVVNHVSGSRGGIAGVYNRSELLPERKAALERWADHVMGLATDRPSNVTPLRRMV